MTDITKIPLTELAQDLAESEVEIALLINIAGDPVDEDLLGKELAAETRERIDANRHFVKVITAELERRERE